MLRCPWAKRAILTYHTKQRALLENRMWNIHAMQCFKRRPTVSKRTLDLAIKEMNYALQRSCLERTETASEAHFVQEWMKIIQKRCIKTRYSTPSMLPQYGALFITVLYQMALVARKAFFLEVYEKKTLLLTWLNTKVNLLHMTLRSQSLVF